MFNIDFPLLLKEISFAYPRKDKFERKNENASFGPKFGQRLRKCLKLVFCWYLLSLHRKLIRLSQHANFKSELRTSSRLPCRNIQEIIGVQPLFILFQSILRKRWKKLFLSEGSVILLQVHLFITAHNYFVLVLTYSTLEHLTCDLVELHVLS